MSTPRRPSSAIPGARSRESAADSSYERRSSSSASWSTSVTELEDPAEARSPVQRQSTSLRLPTQRPRSRSLTSAVPPRLGAAPLSPTVLPLAQSTPTSSATSPLQPATSRTASPQLLPPAVTPPSSTEEEPPLASEDRPAKPQTRLPLYVQYKKLEAAAKREAYEGGARDRPWKLRTRLSNALHSTHEFPTDYKTTSATVMEPKSHQSSQSQPDSDAIMAVSPETIFDVGPMSEEASEVEWLPQGRCSSMECVSISSGSHPKLQGRSRSCSPPKQSTRPTTSDKMLPEYLVMHWKKHQQQRHDEQQQQKQQQQQQQQPDQYEVERHVEYEEEEQQQQQQWHIQYEEEEEEEEKQQHQHHHDEDQQHEQYDQQRLQQGMSLEDQRETGHSISQRAVTENLNTSPSQVEKFNVPWAGGQNEDSDENSMPLDLSMKTARSKSLEMAHQKHSDKTIAVSFPVQGTSKEWHELAGDWSTVGSEEVPPLPSWSLKFDATWPKYELASQENRGDLTAPKPSVVTTHSESSTPEMFGGQHEHFAVRNPSLSSKSFTEWRASSGTELGLQYGGSSISESTSSASSSQRLSQTSSSMSTPEKVQEIE